MSVLDEQGMPRQPLPPAPRIEWTPPPNRRRQILRGLAAVLVLALVGGGIGSLVYIHHYQPLGRAGVSVGGPDDPDVMTRVTDGLVSETWIVRGPAGTTGTVSYTIANNGHFDVTLIGPGPDSELIYHWAKPWLPNPGGGYRQSSLVDARPLPATLHAHQSIELFVTVTKEHCPAGGFQIVQVLPLTWKALGVHHETGIQLDPQDSSFRPIALCYPKSALKHLERF